MSEKMNIHQRVNAVRKVVSYVQKDKAVSTGGGSYKAVTHDAVTGMVRAALIEHGIVIIPSVLSSVFNQKEADAKQRLYEATYQIDFVNCDDPQDKITTTQTAHALDNGDKAPGKAMSYATKYAMLKIFNIETGEDEESRYQQDSFDLDYYLTKINAASSLDELKRLYGEANSAALSAKDKDAQRKIIIEKDKRKVELSTSAEAKQ